MVIMLLIGILVIITAIQGLLKSKKKELRVAKQIEQFNKQDQENIKLSAMDRYH